MINLVNSKIRLLSLCASVALCVAACTPGGGDDEAEEPDPIPVEEEATPDEQQVALSDTTESWTCGSVKQHVHTVVNALFESEDQARRYAWANEINELSQNTDTPQAVIDPSTLNEAQSTLNAGETINEADDPNGAAVWSSFLASQSGFTAADQIALNAACEYYGQHQAALELWSKGERADACDVWIPAKERSVTDQTNIDISVLHPITSKFWAGATGDISEGYGKCIAERAN